MVSGTGSTIAKRVDEYVGRRIRLRRTLLGLTQEDLATELKISYQQVQKYETGSNRVSAGRLYEICRMLDVPVGYLFEDFEEQSELAKPNEHGGRNRSVIDLAQNFSEVKDPAVRAAVLSLVRSLNRSGEAPDQKS